MRSPLVFTLKLVARTAADCFEFVTPPIVSVAAVGLASEQTPPLFVSLIVTAVPAFVTVPFPQFAAAKAGPSATVAAETPETPNASVPALGNVAVIVLFRTSAVVGTKPTVQVAVAPATIDEPAKVTEVTAGSIRYGTGSDASSRRSSRNCAPSRRASDHRRCSGVIWRPWTSRSATGAIRSPVSRPSAAWNATIPSFCRPASRLVPSRQLHVRGPWWRSTWSSCSAPLRPTVTSSCP